LEHSKVANNYMYKLKYDGEVSIATGKSKKELHWKNKIMSYGALVQKLSNTTRTPESYLEYKKMNKADKDNIKDVGGFVAGFLKAGRRKAENVQNRTLITLDLDNVKNDIWTSIALVWEFGVCMYSTHTHNSNSPRYRLVIPLSRPVLPDEYQAVSRKIAADLGIDQFDDTTFEPSRLMYWPSSSCDADYIFELQDSQWLDPDEILKQYANGWEDPTAWPESSRAVAKLTSELKHQEDPTTKNGIVGQFCRTFTISEAITEFLDDIYEPGITGDRYTFMGGSTSGGVVTYDNMFSFSHHGTDPTSNQLCNAFDLVRLHKFGKLDEKAGENTSITKMPSYIAMADFVINNKKVKLQRGKDVAAEIKEDFDVVVDEKKEEENWSSRLDFSNNGLMKNTPNNFVLILTYDKNLKGKLLYNEFSNRVVVNGDLPWRKEGDKAEWSDSDDACLRIYISKFYHIDSRLNCEDAFKQVISKNSFHPVRKYLKSLAWDGVPRIDTLLIDYMGAVDCEYTRIVARKWLCGAVARIIVPGIKFDYMMVLIGDQGLFKSTFLRILSKDWFTDSVQDVEGNQAVEKLMNSWIVEFGELQAFSKSESNAIKRFVTSQEDRTRLAYDRHSSYLKRQCVFAGTTNKFEFLKDDTGNRRYWPIVVRKQCRTKSVVKDLKKDLDQIWAEAVVTWRDKKEKLYMTEKQEDLARVEQEEHRESNEKDGVVTEFLQTLLPTDWEEYNLFARRQFFDEGTAVTGTIARRRVCALEIWCECYGKNKADITKRDSIEINNIITSVHGWTRMRKREQFKEYGQQRVFKK